MEQYQEEVEIAYQHGITSLVQGMLSEETHKKRILVVDDDIAALRSLSRTFLLRMSDVEVDIASSALEALSLIQQHEYDTIVSDIKMPGMDGIELLAAVHDLKPELPVMLITGHGEHDLAMQALQEGAYDYTLKPIDRDLFVAAVRRALQNRQLLRLVEEKQQVLDQYTQSLESQVEQRIWELMEVNQTKDRMLSIVSHELATPLTSLKGMIHVVYRRLRRGAIDKIVQDLEIMERSANRLGILVQDLRDTIHIQTNRFVLQRSHCDLVELCQHVLDEFTVGETPTSSGLYQHELLEVDIDHNRISQALLNLLSNARKYSPKGSPITVILQRSETEAILSVHDRGIGIPNEQLSSIYEPFYCVPNIRVQEGESSGLGLGLYITRAIVEQHGGHMDIQSHPGEGSTFSIFLPPLTNETKVSHESTTKALQLQAWTVGLSVQS